MSSSLRVFALMLAMPLALIAANSPAAAVPPLRVMSFNVRLSSADDGADGWSRRRELFFDVVARFRPSLVGFQEVLADQHDELARRFTEYTFVGVARDDGQRRGEWSLIGFRKDRFTATSEGTFWLSEHPSEPGSKSWNTACTRICTWVRLRDRVSGREFLYANTHFDHQSELARAESAKLLVVRLPQLATGAPIVLTGDFNMNEDDPAFVPLLHPTTPGAGRLTDSYREVHPARQPDEASFHAFHGGTAGSRIDFIFHSPEFVATAATIDRSHSPAGRYPSDHFAVTAVLEWKR